MVLPLKQKVFRAVCLLAASFILLITSALIFSQKRSSLDAYASTGDYYIYQDSLAGNWVNWSWGGAVNFSNLISFTPGPWAGLYLHDNSLLDTSPYVSLSFQVKSSGSPIRILVYDQNGNPIQNSLNLGNFKVSETPDGWLTYVIPLGNLNIANLKISGLAFQDGSGQSQPTMYLDNVAFLAPIQTPAPAVSGSLIYGDSLANGWNNWSWGANVQMGNSITFGTNSPWAGLYLHSQNAIDVSSLSEFTFTASAASNDGNIQVAFYDESGQPVRFVNLANYGGNPTSSSWKNYSINLADLDPDKRRITGIVFQDATGGSGKNYYFDAISLGTGLPMPTATPAVATPAPTASPTAKPTILPTATTTPAATATATPVISGGSGFTAVQNKLYKNGQQIQLKGVNWFGFETTTYAPHGLWARNWKDMISQIKSLGFTSVRVPFCPTTLRGVATSGVDSAKNPDIAGLNSLGLLDAVLGEMNNQGLYILLDHHRPDCNAISELWYAGGYSESDWINDLKFVANRYRGLANFLGIDLKNEPHGQSTWGTGNTGTDWNLAAERAGQAVLATNSNLLVFVEGIQDNPVCSDNQGHWWGGNLAPVKCKPISTDAIPANKLVLSPHVYGPDVAWISYFGDPSFPNNMPAIWDAQYGYLTTSGYTVVPGEWGGKYGTGGGNALDVTLQNALTGYYKIKHICNSYYWDWNPNSGDTGGVLEDDWSTVWPTKVSLIFNYLNSCQ